MNALTWHRVCNFPYPGVSSTRFEPCEHVCSLSQCNFELIAITSSSILYEHAIVSLLNHERRRSFERGHGRDLFWKIHAFEIVDTVFLAKRAVV